MDRPSGGGSLPFKKIWKQPRLFATPRDITTSMKLLHRNLYVANRGGGPSTTCFTGCGNVESMLHLAECQKIREELWNPIFEIIKEVDTRYAIDARLLITGAVDHENTIQPAHWDLIRITWRCIYAEIQRVRLEGVALDLKRVYQRTIRLFYGRDSDDTPP